MRTRRTYGTVGPRRVRRTGEAALSCPGSDHLRQFQGLLTEKRAKPDHFADQARYVLTGMSDEVLIVVGGP